jgi:hypothetical protein
MVQVVVVDFIATVKTQQHMVINLVMDLDKEVKAVRRSLAVERVDLEVVQEHISPIRVEEQEVGILVEVHHIMVEVMLEEEEVVFQ